MNEYGRGNPVNLHEAEEAEAERERAENRRLAELDGCDHDALRRTRKQETSDG